MLQFFYYLNLNISSPNCFYTPKKLCSLFTYELEQIKTKQMKILKAYRKTTFKAVFENALLNGYIPEDYFVITAI